MPPNMPESWPEVAWLTRGGVGARVLRNESAVVATINATLAVLRLRLVVLDRPSPERLRSARGVIGVHGGALSNLHACAPGTVVVEVLGRTRRMGRVEHTDPYWCFGGLSRGVQLDYYACHIRSGTAGPKGSPMWALHCVSGRWPCPLP